MIFKTLELRDFPEGSVNQHMIRRYLGRACVLMGADDPHLVHLDWPGYSLNDPVREWVEVNTPGSLFHVGDWNCLALVFNTPEFQFAFKLRWEIPKCVG